jgi:hypothetical protein
MKWESLVVVVGGGAMLDEAENCYCWAMLTLVGHWMRNRKVHLSFLLTE